MTKELRPLIDALQIVSDIAKGVAGILTGISAVAVTIGVKIFQALSGIAAAGLGAWRKIKDGYNEHIEPLADKFRENWRVIFPKIALGFDILTAAGKALGTAIEVALDFSAGPLTFILENVLKPLVSEIKNIIDFIEDSTVMKIYEGASKGKDAVMAGETNFIGSQVGVSGISDKQVLQYTFNNKIDVSGVTDRTNKESLAKDIAKILQKNIRKNNFSLGGKLA